MAAYENIEDQYFEDEEPAKPRINHTILVHDEDGNYFQIHDLTPVSIEVQPHGGAIITYHAIPFET